MCYEWRRRRTFRLFAGVVMLVPIVLVEQPGTAQTGHRSHRGVSRPDKKEMLFLNIIDNKSRGENNRGIASCDINRTLNEAQKCFRAEQEARRSGVSSV